MAARTLGDQAVAQIRELWRAHQRRGGEQPHRQGRAWVGSGASPVLVRVRRDGGAAGTATTPASWTYALYPYSESDAQPNPLPPALATQVAPHWRATVGDVGAWTPAPDWSVGLAELRSGQSPGARWRLLIVDERLPVVICDPGTAP